MTTERFMTRSCSVATNPAHRKGRWRKIMANAKRSKKEGKRTHDHGPHGPHDDKPHGHKPHDPPYYDPDYEHPPEHGHEPPDNPRYPDPRIYGDYASKKPPRYVPHPFEHSCF